MGFIVHIEVSKVCFVVYNPSFETFRNFAGIFIDPALYPGVNFANSRINIGDRSIKIRVTNFLEDTGFVVVDVVNNKTDPFIVRTDNNCFSRSHFVQSFPLLFREIVSNAFLFLVIFDFLVDFLQEKFQGMVL